MDIEELRTFVEVADATGVTQAARRLGVSKSLVSRRLARLEQFLGVQLLARTTRGASLTEAGATFREHAAKICSELTLRGRPLFPPEIFAAGYVSLRRFLLAQHILLLSSLKWRADIPDYKSFLPIPIVS